MGYVELLENWMCHMKAQQLTFLVVAMDAHMFDYMVPLLPCTLHPIFGGTRFKVQDTLNPKP